MNYSKFIKNNFSFHVEDDKTKIMINILKDIKKTKIIIENYLRIHLKFDIDEYFAYFLKDKNDFINNFKTELENKRNILNPLTLKNYLTMLEIIKLRMDNLLKEYKELKQKMMIKLKKKIEFEKTKKQFFDKIKNDHSILTSTYQENMTKEEKILNKEYNQYDYTDSYRNRFKNHIKNLQQENNLTNINDKSFKNCNKENIEDSAKKLIKKIPNAFSIEKITKYNEDIQLIDLNNVKFNDYEPYIEDAKNIASLKTKNENTDIEATKSILFELSDLMTNFSQKVYEQQEMTKTIVLNSHESNENIQKANKELTKAQEYQKGRGIMVGSFFIFLGLFLLFYDYTM